MDQNSIDKFVHFVPRAPLPHVCLYIICGDVAKDLLYGADQEILKWVN